VTVMQSARKVTNSRWFTQNTLSKLPNKALLIVSYSPDRCWSFLLRESGLEPRNHPNVANVGPLSESGQSPHTVEWHRDDIHKRLRHHRRSRINRAACRHVGERRPRSPLPHRRGRSLCGAGWSPNSSHSDETGSLSNKCRLRMATFSSAV
jgi:hypothetical protein